MATRFNDWIKAEGGVTAVAAKLGIESASVYKWTKGYTSPKALVMQELVRIGKGAFDYDDIINETKKQRQGKA